MSKSHVSGSRCRMLAIHFFWCCCCFVVVLLLLFFRGRGGGGSPKIDQNTQKIQKDVEFN